MRGCQTFSWSYRFYYHISRLRHVHYTRYSMQTYTMLRFQPSVIVSKKREAWSLFRTSLVDIVFNMYMYYYTSQFKNWVRTQLLMVIVWISKRRHKQCRHLLTVTNLIMSTNDVVNCLTSFFTRFRIIIVDIQESVLNGSVQIIESLSNNSKWREIQLISTNQDNSTLWTSKFSTLKLRLYLNT